MSSNFNDRVQSIVDGKYQELLDLFQAPVDRTGDLSDKIDVLLKSLPLIRDIKTEVASCEKMLHGMDSDKDKDKDDKRIRKPVEPEDEFNWRDFLEDLSDDPIMINPPGMLPMLPDGDGGGGGTGVPFNIDIDPIKLAYWLWKKVKEWKDSMIDKFQTFITEAEIKSMIQQIDWINKAVNGIDRKVKGDVMDSLGELKDSLDLCCENMSTDLTNLQSDITTIKRIVSELQPETDKNKDLALQTKTKQILAETQAIRGLL